MLHVIESNLVDLLLTVVLLADLSGKIRVWIVDVVLGNRPVTVDGEARGIDGILSRPKALLDDGLSLKEDTAGGGGSRGSICTSGSSDSRCATDDGRRGDGDGSQYGDESRCQDARRLERRGLR